MESELRINIRSVREILGRGRGEIRAGLSDASHEGIGDPADERRCGFLRYPAAPAGGALPVDKGHL